MINQFVAPDVIWRHDRTFNDRAEELRLERGQFNGSNTYTLRVYWLTTDKQWRWSQSKPSSNGKHWAQMSLKAKELESLGRLLIAEAVSPQPVLDVNSVAPGGRGPMARDPKPGGDRFADGSRADDATPF